MSVQALNTSIANLSALVAARIAQENANTAKAVSDAVAAATANTVPQADVDAAQAAVDTISVTLAPPAVPATPAV